MPNAPRPSIENNFSGGFKTEFTGLNFPENACTQAENCVFSIIGDVNRREGFDFEPGYKLNILASPTNVAINTYKWNNVGGDGATQMVVQQVGGTLYFYLSTAATTAAPLSTQLLATTVNVSSFLATNAIAPFDATKSCTFTDGNGYLFVFNGQCDPFYCSYNSANSTITAAVITVQIRDFLGLPDNLQNGTLVSMRPATLSPEHYYNLVNQGWGLSVTGISTTSQIIPSGTGGSFTWTVTGASEAFPIGSTLIATGFTPLTTIGYAFLTVTASSVTSVTGTIQGGGNQFNAFYVGANISIWSLNSYPNYIQQWFTVVGNYPSNADQWWTYRNTSLTQPQGSGGLLGQFDPALVNNGFILAATTQSPQGAVIFPAFIQNRTAASGLPNLTSVTTTARPTNGCWYSGRVWYTGVNANFQPTGDAPFNTWSETIYFSTIVQTQLDFGTCYQQNDPTSPTLFDLLPSDGGTIVIQGSGAIYKLFPVQNGILVFAANGIWYITGGSAIGFTATQYSVNKISGVQSIGYHSYVNVLGWPVFWNEEGIYEVKPGQENVPYGHGGFTVNNLALGTILTFYANIPLQSKKFARGDYNPLTYTIQWVYRSTNETDVTSRYTFDSALNINTYKGPFFPYAFTVTPGIPYISSILYVASPGGSNTPESQFEYLTVYNRQFTFSQERDDVNWQDWSSTGTLTNYISTFTTGYKLHGQAWRLWWLGYIYVYSNNVDWPQTSYGIRGVWNYGTSGTSGKWSTQQIITNNIPNFGNVARKIRIRGHGLALQLQFNSVTGYPFNFAGWAMYENVNQGV